MKEKEDVAILQRPGIRRGLKEIAAAVYGDETKTRNVSRLIRDGLPTTRDGREHIADESVMREWLDRRLRRGLDEKE